MNEDLRRLAERYKAQNTISVDPQTILALLDKADADRAMIVLLANDLSKARALLAAAPSEPRGCPDHPNGCPEPGYFDHPAALPDTAKELDDR